MVPKTISHKAEPDPVLAIRDVVVAGADGFSAAVPELLVPPGGAVALVGPSGCGKTSVLLACLGLRPELRIEGRVDLLGDAMPPQGSTAWRTALRHDVALVLQDARAALDPLRRLGEQLGLVTGAGPDALVEALATLGIEAPAGLLGRFPHQVSGGQAQRCLLAVALLRRPRLVVADEPTASLDEDRVDDVVGSLRLLRERTGTAVLLATHDHDVVAALDAAIYVHREGVFRPGAPDRRPWPAGEHRRPSPQTVLACTGVGVRYGRDWVVRDFSLALRAGEVVALLGPSGSGKTTVAKVLAGHLAPSAGTVERPPGRAPVQMLFQDAHASLTPGVPVGDLVAEVAASGFAILDEARRLGLQAEHLQRCARELSGGERRRAALLRALSVRPQVLLLDEPTASLDRDTAIEVVETLLAARRDRDLAYLLITHDEGLARAIADRVVRIRGGLTMDDLADPQE